MIRPARKLATTRTAAMAFFERQAKVPVLRTMGDFACQEIILPDGPFEGDRFSYDVQPFVRHWFEQVDSGNFSRFAITGPSQSGKTLIGSVVPVLYHLFEVGETVVFGLPDLDMALDKWREDLLPVIERTQYRELLPREGLGSRGGASAAKSLKFRNGATLKFMTGGGGDKSRSAFTARVLVITEVDGMDVRGATSREADKISQMEKRTAAFKDRRRIYLECTVSYDSGRIWREVTNGTASGLFLKCPHCGKRVKLEREHFIGHESAATKIEAAAASSFYCYECGAGWSEEERIAANADPLCVHRGQSIEGDTVVGEAVATDTLGFRWSAVNNLFTSTAILGGDEWADARDPDHENAEKNQKQFVWCEPYEPDDEIETPLDPSSIVHRFDDTRRSIVPPGREFITVGVDVSSTKLHWVAIAWSADATSTVIDYGELFVYSKKMGVENAIVTALTYLRDKVCEAGFYEPDSDEPSRLPDQVWIDSGYKNKAVYRFIRECERSPNWRGVYRPIYGRGAGRQYKERFRQPAKRTKTFKLVAVNYYFNYQKAHRVTAVILNADAWKSFVHKRLETPVDQPGALKLFIPGDRDHRTFVKHLTAETETREFIKGAGYVTKWVTQSKANHFFDATCYSAAAGAFCGVDPVSVGSEEERAGEVAAAVAPAVPVQSYTMPDGRDLYSR